MKKRKLTSTTDTPTTATIHLRTLRPPHTINETLSDTPLSTTFHSIKSQLSQITGVDTDKLRFLIKGKIITDAKTVSEVVGEDGGEVVVSVMLMGGAVVKEKPASTDVAATAVPESTVMEQVDQMQVDSKDVEEGKEVEKDEMTKDVASGSSLATKMEDETFWKDLSSFLQKRDFGNDEVGTVVDCFKDAWKKRSI